jgi:uncharacterized protein (DUF2252 family)
MHVTIDERMTVGRAGRKGAPRSAHAEWSPAPDRPDPVDVLEQQGTTRVPELLPIRHGRMLLSPFTFFRGAAAIMAADLDGTPTSGLHAQLCGDAHLSNFGIYAAPDRRLVFDVNDFDETLPGPWEWDVKRLAASIEIAGRDRGFRPKQRRIAVQGTVRRYREAMRAFAAMGNLEVWYSRLDEENARAVLPQKVSAADRAHARKVLGKARSKDSLRAVARLTEVVDGQMRLVSDPPLMERLADLVPEADARAQQEAGQALLDTYAASLSEDRRHLFSAYRFVDMARKVVGVGSVGTRAWVLLLEGRDGGDPLVLQAKEAEASVLEEHLGASPYANHGERVVQGQRLMQAASDVLLGWLHATGLDGVARDFYVRQLWDAKGSFDVASMSPATLGRYGELCAWTLARAHARSGDRVAIASYLGSGDTFDRAVTVFAARYADCNEADYAAFTQAIDDGRLAAQAG